MGEPRVCPECGERDEGNDAHDGECSQIFPYLSPSELATFEKLRPCFVEAWRRESLQPDPEDREARCSCDSTVPQTPGGKKARINPACPVHGHLHGEREGTG